MPTRPIAPTRTRRRYDVSLSTPGSELRLPAVPTLRWNWRMFSGLLTLLLLGWLYAFWSMPIFRISAVQITGLQRISERDVKLVLGLTNTPMFILQPEVMQRNLLEAFPEFSNARVELVWPNGVMVSVIERVPVLAWTVGGQRVWVDAQGMSFPARGEGDAPALVVIEAQDAPPAPAGAVDLPEDTNPWFRPFMSPDLVSAILILRGFAPESVPLLYDAAHGLGWLDPNGWRVYFGPDGSDMGQRLQVYQAIVSKLNENQMTPALISVEYLHAPFYRMDQ
jgi:cell division protein FtsQ